MDETSPESPGPETPRQGGAAKSGIGKAMLRGRPENLEARAMVGGPVPATARKPIRE